MSRRWRWWVGLLAVAAPAARPAAQAAVRPADLPDDWQACDLEGKWVRYRQAVATSPDPNARAAWCLRLGSEREFELLEWLAVYEGWSPAGSELVKADAPQWVRAAMWNLAARDSHSHDNARKALLDRAARLRGWFERYPIARRLPAAQALYDSLQRIDAADPGDLLPPLDGQQLVAAYLDVPASLPEFGDRRRAEPGVRYVHQVVRALEALPVWGGVEEGHVGKILGLTLYDAAEVRAAAVAALTRLPPALVPERQLLARVDDGSAAAEERRQALFALSFSAHPRAHLTLLRIAVDAAHPARDVARARLRDTGDAFAAAWLAAQPGPGDAELAEAIRVRLRDGKVIGTAAELQAAVLRLAWAEVVDHPLTAALRTWLATRAKQLGPNSDAVRRLDPELPDDVRFDPGEKRRVLARLREQVRALAGGR